MVRGPTPGESRLGLLQRRRSGEAVQPAEIDVVNVSYTVPGETKKAPPRTVLTDISCKFPVGRPAHARAREQGFLSERLGPGSHVRSPSPISGFAYSPLEVFR